MTMTKNKSFFINLQHKIGINIRLKKYDIEKLIKNKLLNILIHIRLIYGQKYS